MERKGRIAPTSGPIPTRRVEDKCITMERRHWYRVGVGYGRGGYNSHYYQGQGCGGRGGGGYRQDTYRGRVVVEVVEGTETGFEDGMVRGEVSSS